MDDELKQLLMEAQTMVDGQAARQWDKLKMQPAGRTGPAVERAMGRMNQAKPGLFRGINVEDVPFDHPMTGSVQLASTPMDLNNLDKSAILIGNKLDRDPYKIELNPAVGMVRSDEDIERTLIHELMHIKQNRRGGDVLDRLAQAKKPYFEQPDEIEAFSAAKSYAPTVPETPLAHLHQLENNGALEFLTNWFKANRSGGNHESGSTGTKGNRSATTGKGR